MKMFHGDTAALEALGNGRQHNRLLRLTFPNDDPPPRAVMLANRLHAEESLSRDFVYTVEVLSDSARIAHEDVLGKLVTIELVREDGTLRYFNGYVFEFQLVKTDGGFAFYEMVLEPWLSYLKLRHDNATYQNLTVRELTAKVFEPYLKRSWALTTTINADAEITYICQHDETDHNLVVRHWEALGWTYRYIHSAKGHKLELIDNTTLSSQPIDGKRTDMPYQHKAGTQEDDGIHQWSPRRRIQSTRMVLVSFNFKHLTPKRVEYGSTIEQSAHPELEVYENMGAYGYKSWEEGDPIAKRRTQEIDARRRVFSARGNDRTAEPGRWFTLSGHFTADASSAQAPQKYLITSVRHTASNNYQDGRGATSSYSNEIECIPHDVPWRPGRGFNSVQPRVYGPQTAIVVGPPGEEIYTDGFGRVKVQFHWDRKGKRDDMSSPWIRVASNWAGRNFGQVCLPRVGMEVVVVFLGGDPARPLIIGCVYNETHVPPWDLPANKTQSGILTRSTKEGRESNANALRFEDRRGEEEVWLHAEKDQRIEVEHDESHWVGNDRRKNVDHDETVVVKHDRTETVGHDEKVTVRNNREERVDHNETISVGDNRSEHVGKNEKVRIDGYKTETVKLAKTETVGLAKMLSIGALYQTTIGGAMNTTVGASSSEQVALFKSLKVGGQCGVEAGELISLSVGNSRITLTPDAIFLEATNIHLKGHQHVHADAPADIFLNSGTAQAAPAFSAKEESPSFDDAEHEQHFALLDEEGNPVHGFSYRVDGEAEPLHEGQVQSDGRTQAFSMDKQINIVFWRGADE
jgi:type VI secretion system secreted protein VgrG